MLLVNAFQFLYIADYFFNEEAILGKALASIGRSVPGFSEVAVIVIDDGSTDRTSEVARAGVPTVMIFVQSLRGLSHTKLEDTKEEHLELSVQALDRLTDKVISLLANGA